MKKTNKNIYQNYLININKNLIIQKFKIVIVAQ